MRQRMAALGGAGVAVLLGFLVLWGGIDAKPVSAMEQMAENVRKAKSYKYNSIGKVTDFSPDPGKPAVRDFTGTHYWLAPGSTRYDSKSAQGNKEWEKDDTSIYPAGKPGLWINHLNKKFFRQPAQRLNDFSSFDDLEFLGKFSGKADRELGVKDINGKKARGFEIDMQKMVPEAKPGLAEIWIDNDSNLPILVRYEIRHMDHSTTIEMTDIQWNVELPPKLFDATPPEGYADATPKPPTLEEQLGPITKSLAIYAEASEGCYPREKQISVAIATEDLCKLLGLAKWPTKRNWPTKEDEAKAAKAAKAMRGFYQIAKIEIDNPDAAYNGKTVGPSDKDKVLLRWKLDDGQYEVIFGDLRAETVTAENLHALEGR